jgi:Cof subfamily protein (haloacid dehalogenase superfamily)
VSLLPIRLAALDLDGTLFNSRQQITPRTAAALAQAREAGIEICIATGRRHTFAWRMLGDAALQPSELVLSSNGAVIRERGGRLLHRTHLPRELSLELCRLAAEDRDRMVFTFDKVDTAPLASNHAGSLLMETSAPLYGILERWINDNRADILELPSLEQGLQNDLAIQAMVCGSIEPMRALEERFVASLGGAITVHRTEYAARDLCIVDILPAGCGKGVALAWLAQQRGLAPQQVAAVGDNFNDVHMLEFAGHSFLMANASPELLAAAQSNGWHVVPSNEEDGAALALEKMAEFNRQPSVMAQSPERNASAAR